MGRAIPPPFDPEHVKKIENLTRGLLDKADVEDPELAYDSLALSYLLHHQDARISRRLDQLVHRPSGWSSAGYRIMFLIMASGPLKQSELSDYLDVTPVSISRTVANLERDGLVERVSGTDKRSRAVVLTPQGSEAVLATFDDEVTVTLRMLENLDASQRRVLLDLLLAL